MNVVFPKPPVLPEKDTGAAGATTFVHHPLVGSCLLGRDLRCVSLDQDLAALTGLPLEAHLGHSIADALPGLFADMRQPLQRALNGMATDRIEIRGEAISRTAGDRSLVVSLRPMWGLDDSITGVLVSLLDITDHQQAAAALAARTRDLEEVERIATLGSWTWRVGTQEFHWSDQLYRIFGRDPASFKATLDATF